MIDDRLPTTLTDLPEPAYAARRARVLEAMGDDAILVLAAAAQPVAGGDAELRYRPDPDLYYLTGYSEPEAVLVLAPRGDGGGGAGAGGTAGASGTAGATATGGANVAFTLFVRPRDAEKELWTGRRGGVEAARERFGAEAAYPISELGARLPELLAGRNTIYARPGLGDRLLQDLLLDTLARGRAGRQRTGRGARALVDVGALLDELRLHKDAHELALMRAAADISIAGFRECAAAIRDGAGEWEVQAVLEFGFRRRGADGQAFESIVAAGDNATVLHYVANDSRMRAGELLLVDAGASLGGYAADITRTFPVSGRFTPEQRALYDAVLAAHDAAIAEVRPGARFDRIHAAAVRALVTALVDQGLLRGVVDDLVQDEQSYKRFYPHKTSHWLGLAVHDVGDYAHDGAGRPLEPGMVLTIEPGLYLPAAATDLPEALRGTGIRLEDDVLVTADGAEVLTAALPIRAEEVEALVGAR